MKALILSGGKGTRLRPITYTRAKQLLPLANKPVLFYAIESILAAGILDIGIIIGDTGQAIQSEIGDGSFWGSNVRITYILQKEPLGLAHAIQTAKSFLGNSAFIMYLGDNIIEENITPFVAAFEQNHDQCNCQIFLKPVSNPREFGIAEVFENSSDCTLYVKKLVEKPQHPDSNMALVGIYLFDASIFHAVDEIYPSQRGELEITDAIQWLIDHRYIVRAYKLQGYWIDTGKMEDILEANRLVLNKLQTNISENTYIDSKSQLQGNIVIQRGAEIRNSVIRGPAIIGEYAHLENTYIGPFTSVYHNVVICNSEIEHSIILEHCSIYDLPFRIENSLIGRNVKIHASSIKPRAYKFMLGDHSDLGLL
ncbi:glucose-1-phosphate thymidylyltransferase [Dictyobacter kobayashii]|uniref:Glucose-1-phosphate thymidylyltransferase n=1 Tax=Dictyobacter kobayashii TaxID=2014872 RepID=A0A402AC68_9CHLR|nr:glucose-1-phosphate thymidylyltransferase [Dictyobacter kobayashii]GCE16700.1 glucose-1-phosphate thymidylyltransferase [Dictyobacter kobayashii]